ncbi:MAG: bifunctional homocysteine S-methyltransferase/methylenetetrahydrofolate reductase [Bdellovibrionaceae bacterium]|jgi:methionine synthase / methylenetetrahydrofolate reductase(NADPH)|nr:bifunctional homocysteine S-methyltransferase/methylenetetrahydrofolate reductase [Pseudobdellovibrionaceae bacterium]
MKLTNGGIITALYDKGFYINRSFEELCLTQPEDVKAVYQSYKEAGSEIFFTNTFSANRPKLVEFGLQDRLEKIIRSSVSLLRSFQEDDCEVYGLLGPLGVMIEPLGKLSKEKAREYFHEILKLFDEENVDGFCLQGFHDLSELVTALQACAEVNAKKKVTVLFSVQENMRSSFGHSLEELLEHAVEFAQVDTVGICGEVGPSGALTALEIMRPLTTLNIAILPDAGLPRYVNDQYIYMTNPDYMAKFAKRFIQGGADIVGGGAGVHSQHIKAMNNSIRMLNVSEVATTSGDKTIKHIIPHGVYIEPSSEVKANVPLKQRNSLGAKLVSGEKIITVEVMPPKGIDFAKFHEHCEELEAAEVDFINIPDGARAIARMSSLQMAAYIKNNFKNLEPIPHVTTRDRNLLGLQGDLLGSHINGVRNLLLVTGDPPKLGNCPGATGVYDVDAIGLTHIASRFNQGLGLGGAPFGNPTDFVIGVALNPTTSNRELEIQRFKYKIEAGARYAITQPIYSVEAYESFMEELGPVNIPIIMGIWPLVSLRNAEFLRNEVPGVVVPKDVIQKMEQAGDDKLKATQVGMDIAMDVMDKAYNHVAGFQISAPFNKVKLAVDVINGVGLKGK